MRHLDIPFPLVNTPEMAAGNLSELQSSRHPDTYNLSFKRKQRTCEGMVTPSQVLFLM